MALPADFQTGTVTGKFVDLTGDPVQGFLLFTPVVGRLVSPATDTIVIGETISADIDEDGELSVTLPATDDPDIEPTDFSYRVVEQFTGGSTYYIEVPAGGTLDLSDVTISDPGSGGTIVVREGPPGPEGPIAADAGDIADIPDPEDVPSGFRYYAEDEGIGYLKIGPLGSGAWIIDVRTGAEIADILTPTSSSSFTLGTTPSGIVGLISDPFEYDGRVIRAEFGAVSLSQGANSTTRAINAVLQFTKDGGTTWKTMATGQQRSLTDLTAFALGWVAALDNSHGVAPTGFASLTPGDTVQT
jgi:hypothetical protein